MANKGSAYFTQDYANLANNLPGPVPIAVDESTGALLTTEASGSPSTGGSGTTTLKSADGSTALDSYAFLCEEDGYFVSVTAPNETNETNMEGIANSYTAGTVVVMSITQAEVGAGRFKFYLN